MSELIQKNDNRTAIRWKLLTGVSALALTVSSISVAKAEDASNPLIWIELGGQMENISGQGQNFAVPFLSIYPASPVLNSTTPLQAQTPPTFSFGEEASISFQPESSDWVFAAAARIGRSGNFRHVHHQTYGTFKAAYKYGIPTPTQNVHGTDDFADTLVHHKESHAVLDFQAGKDVGLGILGAGSSSTLSVGVRIAQFRSKETLDIRARPDLAFKYQTFAAYGAPGAELKLPHFHSYHNTGQASRSFRGAGPSLSWNGSAPFAGNVQDGEITVDWGVNAALLFGKQKAHVRHQETARYRTGFHKYYSQVYHHPSTGHPSAGHDTDRSVTIPNAGGSVGLSWRVQDFKVSMGYRADFFLGAMDVGIDARKSGTLGFKGPFASVSVALGD